MISIGDFFRDYLPIIISILAVLISYSSYRMYRREIQILLRDLYAKEQERAKKVFSIKMVDAFKNEQYEKGLDFWGIKLLLSNQSGEPIFISEISAQLFFEKNELTIKELIRKTLSRIEDFGFFLNLQLNDREISCNSLDLI